MKSHAEKLVQVFLAVGELIHHWSAHGVEPFELPVSVENLRRAAQDLRSVSIEIREVNFSGQHVRGLIERYKDGSVIIAIRRELSDHMKRATAVKELCHILIDEADDFSIDAHKTIEQLTSGLLMAAEAVADENGLRSEKLAEIAALEILYPYELRAADAEKLAAKQVTITTLSDKYGIPDYLVARATNETSIALCGVLWKAATDVAP